MSKELIFDVRKNTYKVKNGIVYWTHFNHGKNTPKFSPRGPVEDGVLYKWHGRDGKKELPEYVQEAYQEAIS